MILLHAAPIIWDKISGFTASIPALISAQNSLDDVEAALLVTSGRGLPSHDPGFPIFDCKMHRRGLKNLPAPFGKPDLVIFHSTYIPVHAKIAYGLRKNAIPYVITPRGGMTRGAQTVKGLKKRIGNLLFFNSMVRNALALHCLTQGEARETSGWDRPIFVVGNGTEIPEEEDVAHPGRSDQLQFVFIGRLDPHHKGLDMLVEACSLIRSMMVKESVNVKLYGPDHKGGMTNLKSLISRLKLNGVVELYGPIIGEAKKRVLKGADVFVHTSRFEGHPTAVLEALAHGLPCLLTPGTNISEEVASARAGWEVEPSPSGIAKGLQEIISQKASLQAAGERAHDLAIREYSWHRVSKETVKAYRKLLMSK